MAHVTAFVCQGHNSSCNCLMAIGRKNYKSPPAGLQALPLSLSCHYHHTTPVLPTYDPQLPLHNMRSSDTASTTSTLASSTFQSSLSTKLKGKLRTISKSRSDPHGMPLIEPSGGADSETSTLVNFGIDEDRFSSYVLEPLPPRESQGDSDLEEDNTAWSARRPKKQKTRSQPAPSVSSRPGRDAPLRPTNTGTSLTNATRTPGRHIHSK